MRDRPVRGRSRECDEEGPESMVQDSRPGRLGLASGVVEGAFTAQDEGSLWAINFNLILSLPHVTQDYLLSYLRTQF